MISIRLRQNQAVDFDAIIADIKQTIEVINLYFVSGGNDFLVHVGARDIDHLRTLVVDKFTTRFEVAQIETSVIFDYVNAPRLPNYLDDK